MNSSWLVYDSKTRLLFILSIRALCCCLLAISLMQVQALAASPNLNSPNKNHKNWVNQASQERMNKAEKNSVKTPAVNSPGEGNQVGNGMGMQSSPQNQAMQELSAKQNPNKTTIQTTNQRKGMPKGNVVSVAKAGAATGPDLGLDANMAYAPVEAPQNAVLAALGAGAVGTQGSYGASPGFSFVNTIGGRNVRNKTNAAGAGLSAATAAIADAITGAKAKQSQANQSANQASSASSAGEDAIEGLINAMDGMTMHLINIGNENAGAPCSAHQASKTYENSIWMVQRMYQTVFVPMAILFLLPGALLTNMKTMVGFGILHNNNDEDSVHPLAGIFRSLIAIFLIPATQLIMSYMVDVGNSLQDACRSYVNVPLIILWAEEQVQTFSSDQQGGPIKNLPNIPFAPWRGKFAGMPAKAGIMEQVSGMDAALAELANECLHILSEGLTIAHAFQVVMMCYLFLVGPLAAAFFAWPSVGRDLFRKAFASWVDGVVILTLWKFWWNIVLICMTLRCQSGALNPFDPFEVYYLVAFLCILMFVPFNPFDFKPGEIVSHAMEKAQSVAAKVAQGGKGGGSGGGGGGGGGCAGKGAPMLGGG